METDNVQSDRRIIGPTTNSIGEQIGKNYDYKKKDFAWK